MDIYRRIPFGGCAIALAVLLAAIGWAQDTPKKVTKSEAMSAIASRVQPEYPPVAKQLKIQGVVELEVTVGENGGVEEVKIISGNPVLTAPSAQCVKRWKFKPFQEDGKPVRVVAPITLDFKL